MPGHERCDACFTPWGVDARWNPGKRQDTTSRHYTLPERQGPRASCYGNRPLSLLHPHLQSPQKPSDTLTGRYALPHPAPNPTAQQHPALRQSAPTNATPNPPPPAPQSSGSSGIDSECRRHPAVTVPDTGTPQSTCLRLLGTNQRAPQKSGAPPIKRSACAHPCGTDPYQSTGLEVDCPQYQTMTVPGTQAETVPDSWTSLCVLLARSRSQRKKRLKNYAPREPGAQAPLFAGTNPANHPGFAVTVPGIPAGPVPNNKLNTYGRAP